jgi:peptidoglycan/LPS O-acetylase OafA/YrhL
VIPGGVLLTLAGVFLLPEDDRFVGVLFFLGLALTFGLVYLLPKPAGRLTWALYPAGVLVLVAILILLGATNLTNFILPLALLILGGRVLYRALVKK